MTNRVCIFDIDRTLTHGDKANPEVCPGLERFDEFPPMYPAFGGGTTQEVREVIQRCKDRGYEIAIATAEEGAQAHTPKQHAFLKYVDPEVFTDEFLSSPRFQSACNVINEPWCTHNQYKNKTAMFQNIMNYYNIPPSEWKNSIVFDDMAPNLTTASEMGFKVCQASQECGGQGGCPQGCGLRRGCLGVIN